jgi:hypothetical protein
MMMKAKIHWKAMMWFKNWDTPIAVHSLLVNRC